MKDYVLGPFHDVRRFIVGSLTDPPPSRIVSTAGLAQARAVLAGAGCDLATCTEANLHTGLTPLSPNAVYELLATWQLWPCSAFFACPSTDQQGARWFAYRFYKLAPVVTMKLKTIKKPRYIIYDIIRGVGQGGYHTFLIDQLALPFAGPANDAQTQVSIFTTFPPSPLFFEGLHDQVNRDIFNQLAALSRPETGRQQ